MRRARAAAAVVVALAGWPARAQIADRAPGVPSDVDLSADRILYDWETLTMTLEGNVVVSRASGTLHANRGVLERRKDLLTLSGGVIAVQGKDVFVADQVVVDLSSRSAELGAAQLFVKQYPLEQFPPNAAAARSSGKNSALLKAKRVRRLPSGDIVAGDVTLTPCDCGGGGAQGAQQTIVEADYELDSRTVVIHDDRARLESPWLRLLGAHVPLLVPISLPLTDRASGLLFPPFNFSQVGGFTTVVPLFLTLGRSADATLGVGIFTGAGGQTNAALGSRSVMGPRFGGQFRYAPAEGTRGELDLDLVKDLRAKDSPAAPPLADVPGEVGSAPGRGFGGWRGTVRFGHRTETGNWVAAVQGTIASDSMIIRDAQPLQLDAFLDALRTDLGVVRTGGALSLGADATLLQDVRIPNGALPDRRLLGVERRDTFQRLPSAFFQIAPVPVGPFAFSTEASVSRFAPFGRYDPQETFTGFAPTDLAPQPAGHVDSPPADAADPKGLARTRVVRFDVAPRLAWGNESSPVAVAADVGARADAWLFDDDAVRNQQRAYATGGVRAWSTLSRSFGNLLHALTPEVEVRGNTPSARSGSTQRIGDPTDTGGSFFGADPSAAQQGVARGVALRGQACNTSNFSGCTLGIPGARRPYDEIDGAAPQQGEALARASLAQSLWTRGSAGHAPNRLARLELSQDAVLWDGAGNSRWGEAGALLQLGIGPVSAGGRVQLDWRLRAVTLAQLSLGARSARGDEVHASTLLLRGIASERLRAGIDELFAGARIAADAGDLIGDAGFGGSVGVPAGRQGLRLAYDASYHLGALPPDFPDWAHRFAFTYDTPCRCAALQVAAVLPFRGGKLLRGPSLSVVFDLKSLGSFGTP
jgi:lipopolysaccharide export system protein LptA